MDLPVASRVIGLKPAFLQSPSGHNEGEEKRPG
jgi:hypothetical protein